MFMFRRTPVIVLTLPFSASPILFLRIKFLTCAKSQSMYRAYYELSRCDWEPIIFSLFIPANAKKVNTSVLTADITANTTQYQSLFPLLNSLRIWN